jgi:signal transduction histidine kinase
MKLAAQYTRASMTVTVIVLLIAGGLYYFATSFLADHQFDRDLTEEYGEMNQFVQQHQRFPRPFEFDSYQAKFQPIGKFVPPRFADTVTKVPDGFDPGRAIIATINLKGINYRMIIVESKETTQNLLQLILVITLISAIVLLVALFITNRLLLAGLWRPFYKLLQRLDTFSHTGRSDQEQLNIVVDEFSELQRAINTMEEKADAEYQTLKAFTENASHEMMTPVTVITTKLDNIIQDENLSEAHLKQLEDIYNAGNKLSKLSQSLLLLVKIDHQLISESEPLPFDQLVAKKIGQFAETAEEKNIAITTNLSPVTVTASAHLVDILLNNLLGNALRHNYNGGSIDIQLDENRLLISNTGISEALDANSIFERFQKSADSDGTGLGLTIARNIAQVYNWSLTYSFVSGFHVFRVDFHR